jgi:hypothetical protein
MGIAGFFMLMLFRMFFWLMFEVPAVGLMILTRCGTQGQTPAAFASAAPAAEAPPEPEPAVEPPVEPPTEPREEA